MWITGAGMCVWYDSRQGGVKGLLWTAQANWVRGFLCGVGTSMRVLLGTQVISQHHISGRVVAGWGGVYACLVMS